MIIDTHHHLWRYNNEEFGWMDGSMSGLRRDFGVTDLEPHLERTGVQGTVVIQARQTMGETDWLIGEAGRTAFIAGVVGWFDLMSPDLENVLPRYSLLPELVGVRHVLHDEPDDRFMLRPSFQRGMELLGVNNLAYDLLIFPKHLPFACQLVSRFPRQRFVLDHLAKPPIRKGHLHPWMEGILELAKYPNVWCKVSGMVTEANPEKWRYEDFIPYLNTVFNAFGTGRILLGSDWPVCLLGGEYEAILNIPFRYMAAMSAGDQDKVFSLNARECYRLEQT